MAGKEKPAVRSVDRLPPGQRQVHNFPVLDLGLQPEIPREKWELKIHGKVAHPVTLNWAQFMALPQFKDTSDFHCVTTWSQFDMSWEGVAFFSIAELVQPTAQASHVFFKTFDGYSTNNPLDACMDDDVLIAHSWNGQPLSKEHGGPARVILPKRYAWKGAKFIRGILGGAGLLEHGRSLDRRSVFLSATWPAGPRSSAIGPRASRDPRCRQTQWPRPFSSGRNKPEGSWRQIPAESESP
jgi:hypothetical protein